jgi:hypothetical protein
MCRRWSILGSMKFLELPCCLPLPTSYNAPIMSHVVIYIRSQLYSICRSIVEQWRMHRSSFRYMPSITLRNSPLLPRLPVYPPPSPLDTIICTCFVLILYRENNTQYAEICQKTNEKYEEKRFRNKSPY